MTINLGFPPVLKDTFSLMKEEQVASAAAFREMLSPVKKNLYNFIFKALNFSEDADDVFQETVLRAFKYINSYKKKHSFKTWLFTIAHNEVKRYYRKNKDKTGNRVPGTLGVDDFADEIIADNESGEIELIRDIYEIAAELNPKQRNVFFLFYNNKFSIKEIGEITGLKEGNIKFILNRCREIIREKLGVRSKK